jgi:hypothetical protein
MYVYIGLHINYTCFYSILMKLEFSRQIFGMCLNIKFYANSLQWELSCLFHTDGQLTNRHNETSTRSSLLQIAKAPKNHFVLIVKIAVFCEIRTKNAN